MKKLAILRKSCKSNTPINYVVFEEMDIFKERKRS